MPIDFKLLSMMQLRSAPGDVLDRVAQQGEAFIVERNGEQMACLVPLSVFMPDIQPKRLAREFERLETEGEKYATSISDSRELQFHFRRQGPGGDMTLIISLPHGYPNACPKVYANPIPDGCPHRWEDGSLCIFGAMDVWNPGKHDVIYVVSLARRWLAHFATWKQTGAWGES